MKGVYEITSTGWSRQNLIGGIASLQRQRSGQLADGWLTAIGGAAGTEPTAEAIKKKGRPGSLIKKLVAGVPINITLAEEHGVQHHW